MHTELCEETLGKTEMGWW